MTWTVKYVGGPYDGEITEVGNAADYEKGDGDLGGYKLFPRPKRKPAHDDPNKIEGVFLWVYPET